LEKKLIALVFVALLVGLGGGYGLGVILYQPQILELQSDLSSFQDAFAETQLNVSKVESEISTLRTDYNELQINYDNLSISYNELQGNYSELQTRLKYFEETPNRTWHFVEDFTTNETIKISPELYIQGQKWRIKWDIVGVEYYNSYENRTEWWVEYKGWTGFIVYDNAGYVVSVLDIALAQMHFANRISTISSGDTKYIVCSGDPDVHGIHYIFHGEGDFYIEVMGVVTPVALTIESYH